MNTLRGMSVAIPKGMEAFQTKRVMISSSDDARARSPHLPRDALHTFSQLRYMCVIFSSLYDKLTQTVNLPFSTILLSNMMSLQILADRLRTNSARTP